MAYLSVPKIFRHLTFLHLSSPFIVDNCSHISNLSFAITYLFNISCNYTLDIWSYDGVNKKYRIIFTHKIYIIIIKPFSFHGNAF